MRALTALKHSSSQKKKQQTQAQNTVNTAADSSSSSTVVVVVLLASTSIESIDSKNVTSTGSGSRLKQQLIFSRNITGFVY